jgi:hypothetical protein
MAQTSATLKGKRCMCPTRGEFFSSSNGFDKHRSGTHGAGRFCVDPASVGMRISSKGDNSYWSTPMPEGFVFGNKQTLSSDINQ